MQNLLKQPVDYRIVETAWGRWRQFMYPTGAVFSEFRSHAELLGLPWLHYTRGISPETGRRVTARGVIAVGRFAVGGIAIGQVSAGLVSIAQAGIGLLFAFAQAAGGLYALGQLAVAGNVAVGQIAAAPTAVGQLAAGEYVLAQVGFGDHVWSPKRQDAEAVERFEQLWRQIRD